MKALKVKREPMKHRWEWLENAKMGLIGNTHIKQGSTVFTKSGLTLWKFTVRKIPHERHGKLRAEYNTRSCLKLELGEQVRQGANRGKQPSFAPLLADEWQIYSQTR